jgi:putative ABC transport system permease protein
MRYIPLVWAALMRKPTRAVLTLLSVVVAFTLFGMTIGFNATITAFEESARADRIFVNPRFNSPLPVSLERELAGLPGIAQVGTVGFIPGYHQEKKNNVFVMLVDDNLRKVRIDWPLTPAQWDAIAHNRNGIVVSKLQAIKWSLKPRDNFVVAAPSIQKTDGTHSWTFKVLAVTDDLPAWGNGYLMGNFDFLDKARPLADQGKTAWFEVLATDPTLAPALADKIDHTFANSATPLQSITEKA